MKILLRSSLVMFAALTLLTGFIYPAAVTLVGQAVFPRQANGSLVERQGKVIGSTLIGQQFDAPYYFWGRPSATALDPYNPLASGGSNLGPTNPTLVEQVKKRIAALRRADPSNTAAIPVDLVTASGSGLDPDISPAAAAYQAGRVARARGLARAQVDMLIARNTAGRQFGLLGEPRVNVLKLNLALDDLKPVN
jgi:K+-transporting ATPase ATPase C chain